MSLASEFIWAAAGDCGVVPAVVAPDRVPARLLASWWSGPRVFGCRRASRSPSWFVLAPDPSVLCAVCFALRLRTENRCALCGRHAEVQALGVYEANKIIFAALYCQDHYSEGNPS